MPDSDAHLSHHIEELVRLLNQIGKPPQHQLEVEIPTLPATNPFAPVYAALATLQGEMRHQQQKLTATEMRAHGAERKGLSLEEKLKELYLDFVRVQESAESRLTEVESLLEGLRVLTETLDSHKAFRGMLDVLRHLLDFDSAFVLTASVEGGFEVIASTHPTLEGSLWSPGAFFQRVLGGKTLATFDVTKVPEWQSHPLVLEGKVVSALHIPLRLGEQGAMLVCTHPTRGFFTNKHVMLGQRFALLAAQALRNAELYLALKHERDSLDERVQERTQDLAEARDQALEASRLKSELLAKVNHELRTPLGAIIGYADILQEEVHGPLSPKQARVVKRILTNSQELLLYINDLLDQAQIEAGTIMLQNASFEPEQLLETVRMTLGVLAHGKGLTLRASLAPEMPTTLYGDRRRLQQIVINLVTNALKFTEQGGVEVHLFCPDPTHWALEVKDSGPGIAPEAQAYIFEAFRQVDGSDTRRHGGVGLGLAIVKQLVALMEGEIHLKSEPGEGSTFTVLLPIIVAEEGVV